MSDLSGTGLLMGTPLDTGTPDTNTGGVQPGRGGFLRDANDVAYITDPAGATVKSGVRKGLAKWQRYGSPSGLGKQIENTTNLVKWGERRFALGVGLGAAIDNGDGTTSPVLAACETLAGLELDSDEYKQLADRIVVTAKDAAEISLAADRGTFHHATTEAESTGQSWWGLIEAGELLGISREAQRAVVAAWNQMLERDTLEILASEMPCVDDDWRLAGTLDHLARLGRSLRFAMLGGEVVEIPAGTVVVLDKKAGRRRLASNGAVQYWQGYAVQVAAYARSQQYDTDTGERGEWPWPISQDHALIAHLDGDTALEGGTPTCSLVYVDLVAGRRAGELCCLAKAWDALNSSKSSTFSIAQIAAAPEGSVATVESGDSSVAPSSPAEPPRSVSLRFRWPHHMSSRSPQHRLGPVLGGHFVQTASVPRSSTALPAARRLPHARSNRRRSVSPRRRPGRTRAATPTSVPCQRSAPRSGPSTRRTSIASIAPSPRRTRRACRSRSCAARRTVRRYEIARGLLHWSRAGWTTDIMRGTAAAALDDDSLSQPAAALGAVVGQLDATSAAGLGRHRRRRCPRGPDRRPSTGELIAAPDRAVSAA
ncbi:MAG: hypothetical protein WKF58_04875 [Ilumatobacteraceae bacterium]